MLRISACVQGAGRREHPRWMPSAAHRPADGPLLSRLLNQCSALQAAELYLAEGMVPCVLPPVVAYPRLRSLTLMSDGTMPGGCCWALRPAMPPQAPPSGICTVNDVVCARPACWPRLLKERCYPRPVWTSPAHPLPLTLPQTAHACRGIEPGPPPPAAEAQPALFGSNAVWHAQPA